MQEEEEEEDGAQFLQLLLGRLDFARVNGMECGDWRRFDLNLGESELLF